MVNKDNKDTQRQTIAGAANFPVYEKYAPIAGPMNCRQSVLESTA